MVVPANDEMPRDRRDPAAYSQSLAWDEQAKSWARCWVVAVASWVACAMGAWLAWSDAQPAAMVFLGLGLVACWHVGVSRKMYLECVARRREWWDASWKSER